MNAHIDLYKNVEFIVEMNSNQLENNSISELTEFKLQLKNVHRRIKSDRERYNKTKSFYRDSSYRMNDIKEKIGEIKNIIKHKKKPEKKIEDLSKKPKHEYFILAELLATNKIEIHEKKIFQYKDIKYKSGAELGRVINIDFGTKNKAFEQYLNDFKSQAGGKYFLEILDKENNLDEKNVKILKKVFEYFSDYKIEPINKKFLDSFEILKEKNLI